MRRPVSPLICFACLPVVGLAQQNQKLGQTWIEKQILNRLNWSGQRTLGYQKYTFSGDTDAFNSLTNFGTGLQSFTDIGNLSVTGSNVLGFLNFRANFTDNRFSDPEQQQYTLTYRKGAWDLNYGTVQASLIGSNRFINFSRSLDGLVAGYTTGRLATKYISSDTRGAARTVNLEGNNTVGPYYLQSGRIIPDSLQVQVDGEKQVRGRDYNIDSQLGTITFVTRVIPPTSTIVATYESYDFGGQRGKIQGIGATYNLGRLGQIGFNRVEQLTGSSAANPERIEKSFGFGNPNDQYFLLLEPIPESIRVTVNGVPRSFSPTNDGISDFYLDARLPILIISRVAIPTTQEIIFTYRPKTVQTVAGDRTVTGFDYRLMVNPGSDTHAGTYIQYSQSQGQLRSATPMSGSARAIDLRINEGKGDFRANFRKIDPGYQSIEQTGFNRNEDAVEYGYTHFTKGITTDLKTANSLVAFTDFSGNTPVVRSSRINSSQASIGFGDPKNTDKTRSRSQSVSWNRVRATSNSNAGNFLDTLTLQESVRAKKFNYSVASERQIGEGLINNKQEKVGVNTLRSNLSYDAGKNVGISANVSQSAVRVGETRSQGYDYGIRASLSETGPWSGGIDYTVSDSGALASLGGFLNGNAFGFTNNGFSGSGGSGTLSTGQLRVRRLTLNTTHRAGEKLTLVGNLSRQSGAGLSTSNAEINTLMLAANWRINENDSFNIDWSRSASSFFAGSAQRSNSDTIAVNFNGGKKQWAYNFGYNLFSSGGDNFSQRSLTVNGDLSYRLNTRARLFTNLNGTQTRGFFPQDDVAMNMGYAYTIGAGLILQGRYSFRNLRNLDPTATGGAFRSNGFSLELTFDFSSRR
jgi:hypothetical protein